jgi:1-acyl-sn-glycerol-3-phosphate acyltransferase
LNITGTKVVVSGIENIDENEKYIYIANHTNLIDIPIAVKALQHDNINFVYRESLQKVPMLGLALRKSPFIPIVRENSKNAMASVEKANNILKNASVIMFPEGTRSYTGETGKFKRGAFLLATMSNKKIVPISIAGVELITPSTKS